MRDINLTDYGNFEINYRRDFDYIHAISLLTRFQTYQVFVYTSLTHFSTYRICVLPSIQTGQLNSFQKL